MAIKRGKFGGGVTLIEAMVTTVAVAVAALGGLSYQYHAAMHGRIARAQKTATRTVQLLLEDWKTTGGSSEYDPSALGLGFSATLPGLSTPEGLGNTLNNSAYAIEVDGLPMVVMLKYKNVAYDATAQIKLRQIAVVVGFGEISPGSPTLERSSGWLGSIPPVTLSTYVRVDASGG